MPTLLLVDGSSYLYRAFYAMTHLTAPDGSPTNAIYGVLNMLRRLHHDVKAEYCAVIFDAKGENFRHKLFAEYKATRPPMPENLRPQRQMLPELVELMGWRVLQIAGVEADDVIGTLAKHAEAQGMHVIISTGDKDMAQLVNEHITLVNTMKNEILDTQGIYEKFGVYPHQICDLLALMGDKVDNVPGVDKCGQKTAAKWLSLYHSLDEIMQKANEFTGKIGENLRSALSYLPLSYQLVTIKTDVDLSIELPNGLSDLHRRQPDWEKLLPHFQKLGFNSWTKEAEKQLTPPETNDLFIQTDPTPQTQLIYSPPNYSNLQLNYQSVTNKQQLAQLVQKLSTVTTIGLDTETTSLNPLTAQLVGISIALAAGEAFYIPIAHTFAAQQLSWEIVSGSLKPFLENPHLHKIGQNLKYDQHVFANHQIDLKGITGDAMLASYLIESHLEHNLDDLSKRWLGLDTIHYESLCGKGAKQISFADVPIERATEYACQDADFALRIEAILKQKMNSNQLFLYEKIELPVAQVLFAMERHGVYIDRAELARQSTQLGTQLVQLEQQAYELAGQPFNLNSPKQLQEILFEKMGIPTKGLKKTAKGGVSTNEQVLEKLAADYPLPKIILQNRILSKLKSTYTDKLPEMIFPKTQRVHTNYAQAIAITGRLASNNPNLQNIPIRTSEGRQVRRAFSAPDGYFIVSADYSQIELRIMAHLSGDKTLIQAFQQGEDVHRRTASEIFNVLPENVTAEQRRYAKTINFGLIYGMSSYGLAKSLDIDNASADIFIKRYFARYPNVANYMQITQEYARKNGFVETLFGRKLYLPNILAKNAVIRASAERAAINAPMQGTASDLIKLAMIDVHQFLHDNKLKSKLIMQVHDELILEVPQSELALIQTKLPEIMANVGKDKLDVPLIAEVGTGKNWDAAH